MKLKVAIKQLVVLSGPMILGYIGQTLIGAGDVFVASKYSTHAVAAIGVANGIFSPVLLFGIGLMLGVSPLLANHRGAGKETKGHLKSFVIYALVAGFALTFLLLGINHFVPYFGLEKSLIPSIQKYISIIAWTIPLSLVYQGVKEYLQSFEDVVIPNVLALLAVLINIALNTLLVFGYAGFNGLGEVGLPIASIFVRLALVIGIILYALPKEKWGKINWPLNKEVVIFSIPIAIAFFLEVLAFSMVSVISGKLSVVSAAANNIILTLGSTLFMVPLSIAGASAVKIGNALGRKNKEEIAIFIKATLCLSVFYSLFSSSILALLPGQLMSLFTDDMAVISLGIKVCFVAAIFQIVDCTQVSCSGFLRGLQETRAPTVMMLVAFWVIGIPFGIYLAFVRGFDIVGLWVGLATGLAVASVGLGLLVRAKFKRLVV